MASRDYILCSECKTKIIYDGSDSIREELNYRWGDISNILCPVCVKLLQKENLELKTKLFECKLFNEV